MFEGCNLKCVTCPPVCREELTYEMLSLEPRASDDETLESEASIGTADSSENLNIDSEGAVSDFSGEFRCYLRLTVTRYFKKESFIQIQRGKNKITLGCIHIKLIITLM